MHTFFDDFHTIDQTKLWLSPYLLIHQAFVNGGNVPLHAWLNDYFADNKIILNNYQDKPLVFSHQNDLPHGTAYEQFIGDFHKIPTRDNLHDWFGACVWSVFGRAKAILNKHHLRHIFVDDTQNKRNRVRDAITVFDENGIVLAVSTEQIGQQIASRLCHFDWQHSLVAPRQYWHNPDQPNNQTHAQCFLFGHALLEQLINPRKNLCGHTLVVSVQAEFFGWTMDEKLAYLDQLLAQQLDDWLGRDDATPRDLQPLPVLGIPYFWANQDDEFYQDTSVFRAGRRR